MISRKLNNRKESAADHGDPQPITNMVKLAAFLHNGEQYRVYGEFEFKDIKVIAPNEIERTVSLPEFRDLKAVRVKNGKEIAYKPAGSVLKFLNSYLTALLLDNKEYIPLYVRGELLQENEYTLKDIFVCEYKDFQVPKFMYLDGEMYTTKVESFTHKKVYDVILSKKFLGPEDHVLLIDDFLANGCALLGLIDIVKKSGATLEGAGIVIEKGFQNGGQKIRDMGVRLESLAIVDSMTDDSLTFRE